MKTADYFSRSFAQRRRQRSQQSLVFVCTGSCSSKTMVIALHRSDGCLNIGCPAPELVVPSEIKYSWHKSHSRHATSASLLLLSTTIFLTKWVSHTACFERAPPWITSLRTSSHVRQGRLRALGRSRFRALDVQPSTYRD